MMGELGRHPWRRTHASRFPGRRILAPHGQLVPLIMMGTRLLQEYTEMSERGPEVKLSPRQKGWWYPLFFCSTLFPPSGRTQRLNS